MRTEPPCPSAARGYGYNVGVGGDGFTFASSTADYTGDTFLLRVKRDKECWVISEDGSALYGAGRTLLEAMTDFWHAALALPGVVERGGGEASRHIQRQVEIAYALTEVRDEAE